MQITRLSAAECEDLYRSALPRDFPAAELKPFAEIQRLLESGVVVVTGMSRAGDATLLRVACAPGMTRTVVRALARREDTTFAYALAGSMDCIVELVTPRPAEVVLDELPGVPGVVNSSAHPVLKYFRTVHEWQPGVLSDDEVAGLRDFEPVTPAASQRDGELTREDRLMLQALAADGRRT